MNEPMFEVRSGEHVLIIKAKNHKQAMHEFNLSVAKEDPELERVGMVVISQQDNEEYGDAQVQLTPVGLRTWADAIDHNLLELSDEQLTDLAVLNTLALKFAKLREGHLRREAKRRGLSEK